MFSKQARPVGCVRLSVATAITQAGKVTVQDSQYINIILFIRSMVHEQLSEKEKTQTNAMIQLVTA